MLPLTRWSSASCWARRSSRRPQPLRPDAVSRPGSTTKKPGRYQATGVAPAHQVMPNIVPLLREARSEIAHHVELVVYLLDIRHR